MEGTSGLVVLRTVIKSLLIIFRHLSSGQDTESPKFLSETTRPMTVDMPHPQLDQTSLRRLFEVGMARPVSESTRGLQRDTRAGGRKHHSVLAAFKKPTQSRQIKLSVACRRASLWWPRLRQPKHPRCHLLTPSSYPKGPGVVCQEKARCRSRQEFACDSDFRESAAVEVGVSVRRTRHHVVRVGL